MRAAFLGAVFAVFLLASGAAQALKPSIAPTQMVASNNIMPVIKPAAFFEAMVKKFSETNTSAKTLPVIYSKLNEDLYLLYVFNAPKSMRYVMRDDLAALKIKQDDVKAIALKNLIAYYKKVRATFRRIQGEDKGQLYYLGAKEAFEASALLLMDQPIWNGQKLELNGKPVIFMPARNVFMVTGDEDKAGLATAAQMSANFYKNFGHGISPYGFKHSGAGWVRDKP